jgi:chitodextrinase
VVRRSFIPGLVALWLTLAPATAQAANYVIRFQPAQPVAGQAMTFHAEHTNPGQGTGDMLAWDFGDGGTGTGPDVSHTYAASSTYPVTLTVTEGGGSSRVEDVAVVFVAPNAAPSAAFTFTPSNPVEGENVVFSPIVSDPDGDAVTLAWNLGDGTTSSAAAPAHSYAASGDYSVTLTATDAHGAAGFTSKTVTVTDASVPPGPTPSPTRGTTVLPGGATPVTPQRGSRPLVRMRPFPVVRIAGVVLRHGALVKILSVRAPRGSRVLIRCRGGGCPVRSGARTSATRVVRLHRFERRLAAGVTLELFVRQAGRIGKYTRFRIRAGQAPARVDRCLLPGRARPVRCE